MYASFMDVCNYKHVTLIYIYMHVHVDYPTNNPLFLSVHEMFIICMRMYACMYMCVWMEGCTCVHACI